MFFRIYSINICLTLADEIVFFETRLCCQFTMWIITVLPLSLIDLPSPFIFAASLILVSELCLVASGALIRLLSEDIHTAMLVFSRSLLGLMILVPWLGKQGISAINTNRFGLHIMRGTIGVTAMYCLYYAWGYSPLAQAALLKQTAPFFIPIIAFVWLQERISLATKASLMLGFVGVYLVLGPSEHSFQWAAAVALFGAFLGALAKVTVRKMADTEPSTRIVFYFSFFTAILSFLPAIYFWQTPDLNQLTLMLLMAVLSTLAQLLLSRAYSYSEAGILAPFTFSSVVFAAFLGWLFWDDLLTYPVVMGIVLIFSACCLNLLKARPMSSV